MAGQSASNKLYTVFIDRRHIFLQKNWLTWRHVSLKLQRNSLLFASNNMLQYASFWLTVPFISVSDLLPTCFKCVLNMLLIYFNFFSNSFNIKFSSNLAMIVYSYGLHKEKLTAPSISMLLICLSYFVKRLVQRNQYFRE